MIRAVYRDGKIQPLEKVPAEWHDGQKLTVERTGRMVSPEEMKAIDELGTQVDAATSKIPDVGQE